MRCFQSCAAEAEYTRPNRGHSRSHSRSRSRSRSQRGSSRSGSRSRHSGTSRLVSSGAGAGAGAAVAAATALPPVSQDVSAPGFSGRGGRDGRKRTVKLVRMTGSGVPRLQGVPSSGDAGPGSATTVLPPASPGRVGELEAALFASQSALRDCVNQVNTLRSDAERSTKCRSSDQQYSPCRRSVIDCRNAKHSVSTSYGTCANSCSSNRGSCCCCNSKHRNRRHQRYRTRRWRLPLEKGSHSSRATSVYMRRCSD